MPSSKVKHFTGYPGASRGVSQYIDINREAVYFIHPLQLISQENLSTSFKSFCFSIGIQNVVILGISRFLSSVSYGEPLNSAENPLGAETLLQSKFISQYDDKLR